MRWRVSGDLHPVNFFARGFPPWFIAYKELVWILDKKTLCVGAPDQWGDTSWDPVGQAEGDAIKN